MSTGRKIAIGVVVLFVCLCVAAIAFVNWSNSDKAQAEFKAIDTQQAIESATAVIATQQASGTATAVWSEIEARLQNTTLVYENTFEEGTLIVNKFGEDLEPYYRDGIPEVIVSWNGFTILPSEKNLSDFVAEVDCMTNGAFCGIAYNIISDSADKEIFFASGIGTTDQYFFDNHYASLPSSTWKHKNFAPSSAEGFLHHLRLERFGQVMRFYVNGELMEERLLDYPEAVSGDVGFYFGKASDESGIQTVQFDNFRVWELP